MDERALVDAARGGDREAFAALVRQHQRAVLASAVQMLRRVEDAEDAAQEALVEAYRQLPALRDPDKFRPWLFVVLRQKCLAHQRRQRLPQIPLEQLGEVAARPAEETHLLAMLDRLARADREILAARYLHEMTFEEIAHAFRISPGAARVRSSRAHDRLRALLQQEREEEMRLLVQQAMGALVPVAMLDGFAEGVMRQVEVVGPVAAGAAAVRTSLSTLFKVILGVLAIVAVGMAGPLVARKVIAIKQPATATGAAWTRTIAGVGTVELIGVNYPPAKKHGWWGPDGGPCMLPVDVQGLLTRSNSTYGSTPPENIRWVLYRFRPTHVSSISPSIDLDYRLSGMKDERGTSDVSTSDSRTPWIVGRGDITDIEKYHQPLTEVLAGKPRTFDAKVQVSGPWNTEWRITKQELRDGNTVEVLTPDKKLEVMISGGPVPRDFHSDPSTTGVGVTITSSKIEGVDKQYDTDRRMVYLNAQGKEIKGQASIRKSKESNSETAMDVKTVETLWQFGMKLEDIDSIEYQTRPYHTVTFEGVRLDPAK